MLSPLTPAQGTQLAYMILAIGVIGFLILLPIVLKVNRDQAKFHREQAEREEKFMEKRFGKESVE